MNLVLRKTPSGFLPSLELWLYEVMPKAATDLKAEAAWNPNTSKDAAKDTGILEAQLRTNKASSLCSWDGAAYFEEEGHSAGYLGWRGGGQVPNWKNRNSEDKIKVCAFLFTIARAWKQPRCPLADEWIRKLWYIYTVEYYSAIKKNTFESVLTRWMKLQPITQSEVSQKEKHQYSILTHIYEI